MKYITVVEGKEYVIEIDRESEIMVNGERYEIDFQEVSEGGMLSLILNHVSIEAVVEEGDDTWDILLAGELYSVKVQDEWAYLLAQARQAVARSTGEADVTSPMPGTIVNVSVAIGDMVRKGQTMFILESMKMENELKSPIDGIVNRILVTVGAAVEKNQKLGVVVSPEEMEE